MKRNTQILGCDYSLSQQVIHYCWHTAHTGGEGGQDLIWQFLPGAGQALGNREILRGTNQESECTSTWKIVVCGGPSASELSRVIL